MDTMIMDSANSYSPLISKIIKVETLTSTEKRFELVLPNEHPLGHKPGQFVQVSIFGYGEAPISICSSPTKSPVFELTVRRTGRLTNKLHELVAGNSLGIRGPYGNGFDVTPFYNKDVLFVCGGIGLAPLKSLIDYTMAKREKFGRLIILYGTKNPSEILFSKEIEDWRQRGDVEFHMTVDRGDDKWKGKVGVITTLIPPLSLDSDNTMVSVVGPPVMYKYVLLSLKGKRIPDDNIFLSLERRMKCGLGKCGHCQINKCYVCQDGPVFNYRQVRQLEEAI